MRTLTRVILFLILPSLLAGCTMPWGAGGASDVTPPPGGHCANPLFPVVSGAVWEYQGQNPLTGNYTASYTIGTVGAENFQVNVAYSTGVTALMDWTCLGGDLIQMQAGNGPAGAMYSVGGTTGFTESDDISGVTLPYSIALGDAWRQSMRLGGEVTLASTITGSAEGTYSAEYTATGMEVISVPAGTFHALRIDVQVVYNLLVTLETAELTQPLSTSMVLWYVQDVGLVKAENSNDLTGYEVIQLLRCSIP